jgi:hypothetical protein
MRLEDCAGFNHRKRGQIKVIMCDKAGFVRGIHGTESLVVELTAKCCGCPLP